MSHTARGGTRPGGSRPGRTRPREPSRGAGRGRLLPGTTLSPASDSTEAGDSHTAPPTERPTAAPDAHRSLSSGRARRGHEGGSARADSARVERKHGPGGDERRWGSGETHFRCLFRSSRHVRSFEPSFVGFRVLLLQLHLVVDSGYYRKLGATAGRCLIGGKVSFSVNVFYAL